MCEIDALAAETAEVVLSEYGPDLSRFPTEKHFVSHITLAPHFARRLTKTAIGNRRIGRLVATAKELGYQLTPVNA